MDISPTSYQTLINRLLSKMQNHGLGNVTEEEVYQIFVDYIQSACIKFRVCKQNLSDRDNELQKFNIELTDEEIEILSNFMLIEWLSVNYINVPLLLKQSMAPKDWQTFSKRNHLDGLVNLREVYTRETRQMVSAYSIADSDLFERLKSIAGVPEDTGADTNPDTEI